MADEIKRNPGRPKKPFDPHVFEMMCALHCTAAEIGGVMRMNRNALSEKVQEYYGTSYDEAFEMFSADGKLNLRRAQYEKAVKYRDSTMLKHLGEVLLGQVIKREIFGEIKPIELKYSLDSDDESAMLENSNGGQTNG
jgi:hypothetical protein